MLTKIELIAFSILIACGVVGLYWAVLSFVKYIRFGRVSRAEREIEQALANRPLVVNVIDHWNSESKEEKEKRKRGHRSEVLRRKTGRTGVKQ